MLAHAPLSGHEARRWYLRRIAGTLTATCHSTRYDPGFVQFRVLGPLEAECEGRLLDLGRRKQRELLAVLLFSPNGVVSIDGLVAKLWQEGGPPNVISSVHVLVSRLRKALSCGKHSVNP